MKAVAMMIMAVMTVWAISMLAINASLDADVDPQVDAIQPLISALNTLTDQIEGHMQLWLESDVLKSLDYVLEAFAEHLEDVNHKPTTDALASLTHVLKHVGGHLHKIKSHVQPWFNTDTNKVISGFGLAAVIIALFGPRLAAAGHRLENWSSGSTSPWALPFKGFFWCLQPFRLPLQAHGDYLVGRIQKLEQDLMAARVEINAEKTNTESAKKNAADQQVIADDCKQRLYKAEDDNKDLQAKLCKAEDDNKGLQAKLYKANEDAVAASIKIKAAQTDTKHAEIRAKHAEEHVANHREKASEAEENAVKARALASFHQHETAVQEVRADMAESKAAKAEARAKHAEAIIAGYGSRMAKVEATVAEHGVRIAELRARDTKGESESKA